MNKYRHFIVRYTIVLVSTVLLSLINVRGNATAVQSLFTVLGISFSISMSLIISFDLSQIVNKKYREPIKLSVKATRNGLIWDFIFATFVLLLSSLNIIADWELVIKEHTIFHFQTFAVCFLVLSIFYEARNFIAIHDLHDEIADAVIKEKNSK